MGADNDKKTASDAAGDPYHLERFVAAQDAGGTYQRALAELRAGRKASHWMWFIFPQVAGLGLSSMAQRYAISGLPRPAPTSAIRCSDPGCASAPGPSPPSATAPPTGYSARSTR